MPRFRVPPAHLQDSGSAVRWPGQLTNHERRITLIFSLLLLTCRCTASESDKTDRFLDKINEQSIAAVFNKVAYGSTTKRSIPDNAYLYTTLATPLLTTYRYSDGNQEWYRVDVKEPEGDDRDKHKEEDGALEDRSKNQEYGSELEKDHVLPTSAPAADILKNNNNKNYNNPNRYNNDRLRPDSGPPVEIATERDPPRTSTGHSVLRNVRPTKSMFGKELPSYVPPSRSFFTPPLPPEYLNPFADKPTLRGTNSDSYQNRRPLPPPSLMPKKDRIPFRPDLPPNIHQENVNQPPNAAVADVQKKKTLNTPSQNANLDRFGEFYGLNRLHNESNFEYEPMVLIPSISRILSGSNGRKEEIPDILLRTVTAAPPPNPKILPEPPPPPPEPEIPDETVAAATIPKNPEPPRKVEKIPDTTTSGDVINLPNVKIKPKPEVNNMTKASSGHEIWHVCWNVHVYLVVFLYVVLTIFSIVKLVKFDQQTHMFSKSYFLSVHLLLTVICVMRIFYLAYDPYNIGQSLGNFSYELLHNLPLSLLATTFAILIVFLLKRTLNHLKVKTRPVFLVLFGLGHIFLCFCLNLAENFNLYGPGSFWSLICRFVYILLCWSLGLSYVYLYKIIKNVLAKKSQNLSEICTQNISYASHITIAVALLFTLLGFVELYGLFFIKIDRFTIPYHWILWGFELSIRLLEISIITLLAIVVSLKMSQREKQNVGFPLFPCTTSDSSTDNIYPNNCSTNLNALNYSLRSQYRAQQDMNLENIPTDVVERPNLLEKKSTLERNEPDNFDRFERPNWPERENFPVRNFEKDAPHFERTSGRFPSGHFEPPGHGSGRLKPYEKCRYYAKSKYDQDVMYNSSSGGTAPEDDAPKLLKRDRERDRDRDTSDTSNVYSEPLDVAGGGGGGGGGSSSEYERPRYSDLERSDCERRSRSSWTNSGGRRSTGRRKRPPHTPAVHTLPPQHDTSSMLVDDQGFVRFRQLATHEPRKHRHPHQHQHQDASHYSDA